MPISSQISTKSAVHGAAGIQEAHLFPERTREVFPGYPEIRDGCLWSNDQPGFGIDLDEPLAVKFPFPRHRIVDVYPDGILVAELREGDVLDGENILPGFTLPVSRILA